MVGGRGRQKGRNLHDLKRKIKCIRDFDVPGLGDDRGEGADRTSFIVTWVPILPNLL